jgi:hypothetical protein
MRLVATEDGFYYSGRNLRAGEAFEAPDEDAAVLRLIGKAKDAARKPRGQYLTRQMQAED